MKATVLLVETGPQDSKEYILKKIIQGPYRIFLLKNSAVTSEAMQWYRHYFSDEFVLKADFRDPSSVIKTICQFMEDRHVSFDGVMTYMEESVPTSWEIAHRLNLRPISKSHSCYLRHKAKMRDILTRGGILQPKFIECSSLQDVLASIDRIGFPCIIKPAELLASLGVFKIESDDIEVIKKAYHTAIQVDFVEEDLRKAYNLSLSVIVEEYIPTKQEISVEGFVQDGQAQIVTVTKKYLGKEPTFTEIGHACPYVLPDPVFNRVKATLIQACQVLQLENTVFHAEFRIHKNNEQPVMIEIGARLAGDYIPLIVNKAMGFDFITAALDLAVGTPVHYQKKNNKAYAIHFIQGDHQKQMISAQASDCKQESFMDTSHFYPEESEGHLGFYIIKGDSIEQLEHYQRVLFSK